MLLANRSSRNVFWSFVVSLPPFGYLNIANNDFPSLAISHHSSLCTMGDLSPTFEWSTEKYLALNFWTVTVPMLLMFLCICRLLAFISHVQAAFSFIVQRGRLLADITLTLISSYYLLPPLSSLVFYAVQYTSSMTGEVLYKIPAALPQVTSAWLPLSILVSIILLLLMVWTLVSFVPGSFGSKAGKATSNETHNSYFLPPMICATTTVPLDDVVKKVLTQQAGDWKVQHEDTVKKMEHLEKKMQEFTSAVSRDLQGFMKNIALTLPSVNTISAAIGDHVLRKTTCEKEETEEQETTKISKLDCSSEETTNKDKVMFKSFSSSKPTRRFSSSSHASALDANLDEPDDEVLAILTWQRQPKPKSTSSPNPTAMTPDDHATLSKCIMVEEAQEFLRSRTQQRRPAARGLTDAEKLLSLDALDYKWRSEEYMRRQSQEEDNLGYLTEEQKNMPIYEVKRLIRGRKQQLFFERKKAEGIPVFRCDTCQEWYMGEGSHHCTKTGWKLVGQNKDIPVSNQFVVTQRGGGDVRVRRMTTVDEERLTTQHDALVKYKKDKEEQEALARSLAPRESHPTIPNPESARPQTHQVSFGANPKSSVREEDTDMAIDLQETDWTGTIGAEEMSEIHAISAEATSSHQQDISNQRRLFREGSQMKKDTENRKCCC